MPAQAKASSSVGTWTSLASGLSYEPFGAVKAMTLGNGLAVTNDWGAPGSASATGGGRLARGGSIASRTTPASRT